MRKISLMVVIFIFCSSLLFAESSKEFSVIWSLIDSLHLLRWGSSYEFTETDELSDMMTKLMNQNSKYEDAARKMGKYVNDKDEYISMVSKGIWGGVLLDWWTLITRC